MLKRKYVIGVLAAAGIVALALVNIHAAKARNGVVIEKNGMINCYKNNKVIQNYNGMATDHVTGKKYWFDSGVVAREKEAYDPGSDAWYWFDADGTMARDKDVYLTYANPASDSKVNQGKWVRYDKDGRMVKGEDYKNNAWYYFDENTGAMQHGERIDGVNWYYYDDNTGVRYSGFKDLADGRKVYYDDSTGIMAHGKCVINEEEHFFDPITGIMIR